VQLMASVHEIMQRAEAEGRDPDNELRQLVERTVLEGVVTGFEMSEAAEVSSSTSVKRPREDV